MVGILVLGGLGAVSGTESEKEKIISETVLISQPIVKEAQNYVTIDLTEATTNSNEENKPTLPVVTKVFTFPFGTTIDTVEVTFSETIEKEISKPITPSPKILMRTGLVQQTNIQEEIMTYSDIDIYPEQRFGIRTGAGLKDGEHVVYLSVPINMVQYMPKENKILYSEKATIDVTYTLPEKQLLTGDTYDYLILTPSQFESALQRLADLKNNMNPPIRTTIVTLDEIPSGVGEDEQEDIKYYIRDAIENWGITYVLLVGAGVEGSELFPVRKAWISDVEDWFPSDLYYADVYNATGGFPDWDYDDDGKYGEYSRDVPNIDVHPDVYIARIPCNNVIELNALIDKIVYYKEHNKMTKKIVQAGGDTFSLVDGDNSGVYEGEYANTKVMEKLPGYTTTQLWGSKENLLKSNIANGFKNSVDFVDFSGHGSPYSWATHPPLVTEKIWIPPKEGLSQVDGWSQLDFGFFNVKNSYKYPVVVYNSCSNNKFTEYNQCMGWRTCGWKNGGGVAAFAAAGIGYGAQGTSECERVMGWMEVHIFEEMLDVKILGQAWGNCISGYYNTFENDPRLDKEDYKTMLEFCMFGDPTLAVQDGDDPKPRTINRPVYNGLLEIIANYFPRLERLLNILFK